jgi:hypothetical protein
VHPQNKKINTMQSYEGLRLIEGSPEKQYNMLYSRRGIASLVGKETVGDCRPDRGHRHSRHLTGADGQVRRTPSRPSGRAQERAEVWLCRVARTEAEQGEGAVGRHDLEDGDAVRPRHARGHGRGPVPAVRPHARHHGDGGGDEASPGDGPARQGADRASPSSQRLDLGQRSGGGRVHDELVGLGIVLEDRRGAIGAPPGNDHPAAFCWWVEWHGGHVPRSTVRVSRDIHDTLSKGKLAGLLLVQNIAIIQSTSLVQSLSQSSKAKSTFVTWRFQERARNQLL